MSFEDFLQQVLEQGIAGAKRDYKRKDQQSLLKGSIQAFEDCRG